MAQVEATINVNVQGLPELRREVAQIIRDVASQEADPRVAARLHEVAALVAQTVAEREAVTLVKNVVPHTPRGERQMMWSTLSAAVKDALVKTGEKP